MNLEFFWDKKIRKLHKSRFNLLILEYGEYFLEDYSAYYFPIPTNDLKKTFEIQDSSKIQGRLKLCTRSLVFEPNDVRYPILKFPYRGMNSELERFNLKPSEYGQLTVQVNGFFTFVSSMHLELKANNKIGPYKVIESAKLSDPTLSSGQRMLFALVHSELQLFLVKIEQFRHICALSDKVGSTLAHQHLKPFIENALISSFDASNLVDFHEKFLIDAPISVRKIKPLVANPGSLMITESRIYFQPAQLNNIGDNTQNFELRKVSRIYKRRHMLRSTGIEFILSTGSSYLFIFDTTQERDKIYELISHQASIASKCLISLEEMTKRWQRKEITNFEYLMHLNNEAGRTTNDLTQYPVFPHILKDYQSSKLNLDSVDTFRDLSKPIGALNDERLKYFKDRFLSMPPADPINGIPPPFLYGTHYSTPGYVLYYLVRVAPEYMLCLQNGRFDAPDRMFHSVSDTWESCLHNPADLKELIPEFFIGSGDFLVNSDDLDLGHRHSGERLNDVELPPWADTPRDFIRQHARALESDYVSRNLHHWIDLIFGYKQQGKAAIQANNLYYYLTYEGAVDLDSIKDVRERAALENQIQEFGQTPKQLFQHAHPSRNDIIHVHSAPLSSSPLIGQASSTSSKVSSDRSIPPSPSKASSTSDKLQEEINNTQFTQQLSLKEIPSSENKKSSSEIPSTIFTNLSGTSTSSTTSMPVTFPSSSSIDITKLRLFPSDQYYWHSKAITGVSVRIVTSEGEESYHIPQAGKRKLSAIICSIGKDSTLKVIRVELDMDMKLLNEKCKSKISNNIAQDYGLVRCQCTIARSFAASGSTLSACHLCEDKNRVIFSSWDNHIYGYSIVNATALGKRYAHYDSVTSISVDKDCKSVMTGSLDGTVKVWTLKAAAGATNNIFNAGASIEFSDHEFPVQTVAMSVGGEYGAGGGEDGSVIVWDLSTQSLLFSYADPKSRKPVVAMKWIPLTSDKFYEQETQFDAHKLLVSFGDGKIFCFDCKGSLYADLTLEGSGNSILCIDSDGRIIACGCSDGSLRLYRLFNRKFLEIQHFPKCHNNAITAISFADVLNASSSSSSSSSHGLAYSELLVTGSEDCSIRLWRITYDI